MKINSRQLKQLLVKWLTEDNYPVDSAINQIERAKITQNKGIYTIKYHTGTEDNIKIVNGVIEHLDPFVC